MTGHELKEARESLNMTVEELAIEFAMDVEDIVEMEASDLAGGKFWAVVERAVNSLQLGAEFDAPEHQETMHKLKEFWAERETRDQAEVERAV